MDSFDLPLLLLSAALSVVFGVIPALIARSKGRNFLLWWLYGALASPIAFVHAMLISPNRATVGGKASRSGALRRCPHCGEVIAQEAEMCRHCGRTVPAMAG
jgi:hypothetical protein